MAGKPCSPEGRLVPSSARRAAAICYTSDQSVGTGKAYQSYDKDGIPFDPVHYLRLIDCKIMVFDRAAQLQD